MIQDRFLNPRQRYVYSLMSYGYLKPILSSEPLAVSMMDTTSHDFTWTIERVPGRLNDVAIVNDTLVYAAGEIYLQDSAGTYDPIPYNFAVWNGRRWAFRKAMTYLYGYPWILPAEGVFAFSEADIWLAGYNPMHGDGISWTPYNLPDFGVIASASNAWGVSPTDMYFVGKHGSFIWLDGSTWYKLDGHTTLDVGDVWGGKNEKTGQWEILAAGGNAYEGSSGAIFQFQGRSVGTMPGGGIAWPLSTVWFVPGRHYYAAGYRMYEKYSLSQRWWSYVFVSAYSINKIRGNDVNDIAAAGDMGELLHYNGMTWKSYRDITGFIGSYNSLAMRGNLIVAVGEGMVAVGRRNPTAK